ncbi:MAG: hypothetical protein ACI9YT_000350 [Halobacteriales archaeon]|jgi:hypothetical protein
MSNDRSGHVYRLHSTLELPLETVHEFFDDADLPEGIADVEITRRNNTLILRAVAADESISKYTPTAQLKASITENRVYEEEPPDRQPTGGPAWGSEEEEEPPESELVEFAAFKGDRETVLQNSKLQYQMFQVLRDLALEAEKGTLTAITAMDGELDATFVTEGEERPASIEVTEGPRDDGSGKNGVDWRDNKFISE